MPPPSKTTVDETMELMETLISMLKRDAEVIHHGQEISIAAEAMDSDDILNRLKIKLEILQENLLKKTGRARHQQEEILMQDVKVDPKILTI